MSAQQWAAIMTGDESYAGCRSFFELEEVVQQLTGYRHVFPVHQGRAAERILFGATVDAGHGRCPTTRTSTPRARTSSTSAPRRVDFVAPQAKDLREPAPWKGDSTSSASRRGSRRSRRARCRSAC
jgi:tryptophanase